jgi:hypothetical protein
MRHLRRHALQPALVTRPAQLQPTSTHGAKLVICEQSIDITYVPTEQEGFLFLAVIPRCLQS